MRNYGKINFRCFVDIWFYIKSNVLKIYSISALKYK